MADQPAPAAPPAKEPAGWTAWLKPVLGAVAGLFSGAVMMYMSPLLDKVFKPAKPVANFAVDHEGLTVTFHNRSMGVHAGWWDFGDGSPLELVQPTQEIVTHAYAEPGDYTIKLQVRNSLGEPDERTVNLHLDTHNGPAPEIEALEATPVSPGGIAPATFRVVSKVKNAKVCVWDLDDDRPLDIVSDCTGGLDRLVTFEKPGGYVIKLAAVNGDHAVEKSELVQVMERPAGYATAVLTVTGQATHVERVTTPFTFVEQFPAQLKDDAYGFQKQAPARQGFEILSVRLQNGQAAGPALNARGQLAVEPPFWSGMGARNLELTLAGDRKSVRLTGELARDMIRGKKDAKLPSVAVPVVLEQERRTQAQRPAETLTASFKVPGSVKLELPELPKDWEKPRRQVRLELRDGDQTVFQDSVLPRNKLVKVQNKNYRLKAELLGDIVRIDMDEDASSAPAGN